MLLKNIKDSECKQTRFQLTLTWSKSTIEALEKSVK